MDLLTILLQLDPDRHASTFDAIAAKDAGVETLLQYSQVSVDQVTPLVHGAMFTRGGDALRRTAIFIGGSDVAAAESLLEQVRETFFGPVRVSVMFDANGCNTTAAAAVLSAKRHLTLSSSTAVVLGGTGPVGLRVARLLARAGCHVRLASRREDRAAEAVALIRSQIASRANSAAAAEEPASESLQPLLRPVATPDAAATAEAIAGCDLVFACGAAGVELVDRETLQAAERWRVAVDLNAVPPGGIGGIKATDRGSESDGRFCYGAIGVGGLKMKIHRAAVQRLFDRNDQIFDAEEILAIGETIV
ncbi:NAD(P)-dependent methylenetetrahydromethanopterin dehydrogenase [Candidatus Laterigemmans baculatus]|uniref:NAD(P)-dependent methylenetetrahydromethanopterin dehydrogenase n=1 Tax=Candidatus Laterigemmans baculatus TaxID=2770505 RepID=UPI001F1F33A8|nr:NAD(P)-dependent methylenetetrahydromethanopterin dehydrogenase [Candidatus Laterigemmans baculatus]